mgnify:FL=1
MSDEINAKKIELPIETKYLDFLYNVIKEENSEAIVSSFNKNLLNQYFEALLNSKNIHLYICELNQKSVGYVILSEKPSYLISNFKKLRTQILINLIINLNIKTLLNLVLIICKIDLVLLSPEKRNIIDNCYNLNLLAIDRNYQSKGIGKVFMTYVFENLSKMNKLNYLTVETNNERTGRFYEKKLGFTYFGKKIRFFKFQKIYKKNFT